MFKKSIVHFEYIIDNNILYFKQTNYLYIERLYNIKKIFNLLLFLYTKLELGLIINSTISFKYYIQTINILKYQVR